MDDGPSKGCIISGAVVALMVVIVAIFLAHAVTTTRRVEPGNYGVVIFYHNDGSQDIHVYTGGTQYYVEWGSNVKEFEYPATVQTIKIYRDTHEGIAPYADDIYCNDTNGVRFSGDLQARFLVAKSDVYTVYSQHQDMPLNGTGQDAVDSTIAGVVVRPALQEAWKAACASRTYADFEKQEYTSVAQDILNYAGPLLKKQGITLVSVEPQTVYLPPGLQDSLNAIAKANADLQASQIDVQIAKNEAAALDVYQQEIAKNPALLKLIMLEKILAKWDGHGIIPTTIQNAGN